MANIVQEELYQVFAATQDHQVGYDPSKVETCAPSTSSLPTTASAIISINASTTSDITLRTMQQQMAMMQHLMLQQMAMTQQPVSSKNKLQKSKRKWNQMKYCWTCGACNHWIL